MKPRSSTSYATVIALLLSLTCSAQISVVPTRVKDLNPNGTNRVLGKLVVGGADGKTLFFSSVLSGNRGQVFASNGTTEGTSIIAENTTILSVLATKGNALYWHEIGNGPVALVVQDLVTKTTNRAAPLGGGSEQATFLGNDLICGMNLPSKQATYKVKGGTVDLTALQNGSEPGPANLVVSVQDRFAFFAGNNPTKGYEPYVTDGTPSGTLLLKDINPSGSSSPGQYAVIGDKVYFSAENATGNAEPWYTDGTTIGTKKVKEVNPSASVGSDPKEFVAFNGKVYFTATNSTLAGRELWVTDGTATGTSLLKDLRPKGGSDPHDLVVFNKKLWFFATDASGSEKLFSTDGTAANTAAQLDLPTGTTAITPIVCNGKLFYVTKGGNMAKMWRTDGTAAGTQRVTPAVGAGTDAFRDHWYNRMVVLDNWLYFFADFDTTGYDLWKVQ